MQYKINGAGRALAIEALARVGVRARWTPTAPNFISVAKWIRAT